MARILFPLPDHDFDVTEVVVPWKTFRDAGHEVVFATENGATPACDPLLLVGVIFGQLGANEANCALYRQLEKDPAFLSPIAYEAIAPGDYDLLHLSGGHAPGMRQYLDSQVLRDRVAAFSALGRPIGAICHGSLVLARTQVDGKPLLQGRTATGLPWWMEMSAWLLTFWKLGRYYRTYDITVQDEMEAAGASYQRGPLHNDYSRPFVVEDGDLVTARWPGDAQAYANALLARLS
ncbi:MAG: thiamine biosynthesis protein ThiJ [Proteobacteria bacterium]|nr:thiamine biosynthesis protein ThiJ [Pseudomonadota bacterium]MCP4920463.1 thiamine biosynthesis protein ThiJ [Pseudomonadota bacterium]